MLDYQQRSDGQTGRNIFPNVSVAKDYEYVFVDQVASFKMASLNLVEHKIPKLPRASCPLTYIIQFTEWRALFVIFPLVSRVPFTSQ